MAEYYKVTIAPEGGDVLVNADHVVAVKKRQGGGFRIWLSTSIEVGDEPDRLLVLAGTDAPKDVKVLNVTSSDLERLLPAEVKA